jgi:hypothetical protein
LAKNREYALADALKSICIDVLGLNRALCYGSNDDKNTLTHLKWEDMPGLSEVYSGEELAAKRGLMTVREVLQYVGTKVFRRMFDPCWINACFARIAADNVRIAVITDVRFPNEVVAIQSRGGYVVRLSRAIHKDADSSETALDDYPKDAYWLYVDNANMTADAANAAIQVALDAILT